MELPIRKPRKSFTPDGVQFAWDATSIAASQKCMRYYKLSVIDGWTPNNESEHIRFGGHFATALEHYYKFVALGMEWEQALFEVTKEALEATWDRTEDNPEGRPWVSLDANKTRENLIRTIVWYIDQFHDEEVQVKLGSDGKPLVEHSFAIPVDNDIILTGHIDRVVEWVGDPYVMDQKTTGQTITPKWFRQFKPNVQFSLYTFAGKMIWDLPIKGVIIDGAQIAVGFSRFERSFSPRTDAEVSEWYDDTMQWVATAQQMTLDQHFPMNPSSCGNYGGCTFLGVCEKSPGLRDNFLRGSFHIREDLWDPLERR